MPRLCAALLLAAHIRRPFHHGGAGRRGGGVLQGQARHAAGELRPGRRLRRLCARAGAPHWPAYPRQSQHRGAEHAGRGLAARRQLPLQRRAQGRHGVRHLRAQHGDARPAQERAERPVRSDEIHLARLVVEPRERRLCADPAARRQGEDDRGRAPRRRTADHPRQHRGGHLERRHGRAAARMARLQPQGDRGLHRLRRAVPGDRARRGRRPHRRAVVGESQQGGLAQAQRLCAA